jgi:hypothetical protein
LIFTNQVLVCQSKKTSDSCFHLHRNRLVIDGDHHRPVDVGCEAYYTGRYDDVRTRFLSVLDDVKDRTFIITQWCITWSQ